MGYVVLEIYWRVKPCTHAQRSWRLTYLRVAKQMEVKIETMQDVFRIQFQFQGGGNISGN